MATGKFCGLAGNSVANRKLWALVISGIYDFVCLCVCRCSKIKMMSYVQQTWYTYRVAQLKWSQLTFFLVTLFW